MRLPVVLSLCIYILHNLIFDYIEGAEFWFEISGGRYFVRCRREKTGGRYCFRYRGEVPGSVILPGSVIS